jgi:signal peptidase II
VVLAGADQAIKAWIVKYLENGARVVDVTGFFRLVIIHNEGISFGMLNGLSPQISFALTLFAAAVTIGLLIWLGRTRSHLTGLALGLLIGGAIGNIVDRLRFGAVIDFLYFHYRNLYWPAFNLADSAVVTGVALLLLQGLVFDKKS